MARAVSGARPRRQRDAGLLAVEGVELSTTAPHVRWINIHVNGYNIDVKCGFRASLAALGRIPQNTRPLWAWMTPESRCNGDPGGPPATIGSEPRQARKGATVIIDSCAGVRLSGSPPIHPFALLCKPPVSVIGPLVYACFFHQATPERD